MDYVGLLVLGVLNASIPRDNIRKDFTHHSQAGEWRSKKQPGHVIRVGSRVVFRVVSCQKEETFFGISGSLMTKKTGCLDFLSTAGKEQNGAGDGLNYSRRNTERWLAPIKPHLQHLGAASSAGTSLVANRKHISVTLATWDAVWEVYLDPTWLEKDMVEVSMQRHERAKQLVVFFGAVGIGTQGGPRGTAQLRGMVVQVDEHRTSRVSSAVNGKQPREEEPDHEQPTRRAGWKHPAGQVEHRLLRPAWSQQRDQPVRGLMWCPVVAPRKPPQAPRSSQAATQPAASEPGPSTPPPAKRSKRTKAEPAAEPTQPTQPTKGKAAKAKPAPQPGRWLDRDCSAALNMQHIGESRWRLLELCHWPDQGALPAKGKEYPGLGYKRLRGKPPKAQQQQQQQQQQQPAEAQ
ncbi:hypothetical protein QJQ45_010127 [Haematococcus lacustris]|nr:hypothetical protein QJQ45_010127 [Haematococcus lacustris]